MLLTELNQIAVSKLISQQIYSVICLECCKYYEAPETASCGHTLCHGCWSGRQACPVCALPLNKKALKPNTPLQSLTEHVHALCGAFEKLFDVKLTEMELEPDKENDPINNVKEWLASSQNHFSAPISSSQDSTIDAFASKPVELSASKIQIHADSETTNTKKETLAQQTKSLSKPVPSIPSQDDWDKIEVLPDSEDITKKNKENITSSNNNQTPVVSVDEKEYSTDHPRRSRRKRENKTESDDKFNGSGDKSTSKKTIQNWSSVKKMRKEFSKLNKKDRNKLNVSIEMCKKAHSNIKKDVLNLNNQNTMEVLDEIEDQTPCEAPKNESMNLSKTIPQNKRFANTSFDIEVIRNADEIKDLPRRKSSKHELKASSKTIPQIKSLSNTSFDIDVIKNAEIHENQKIDISDVNENTNVSQTKVTTLFKDSLNKTNNNTAITDCNVNKMVFLKKGNLCQNQNVSTSDNTKHKSESETIKITQKELDTSSVTMNTDDIEISIKVGNTVTNILIKKKASDVQMKVNTDREIQTSLGPYTLPHKDAACSPMKSVTKKIISQKTADSVKKNTASADTTSAHFVITESVEKELSNLMECEENIPEGIKAKKIVTVPLNNIYDEPPSAVPLKTVESSQPKTISQNKVAISQTNTKTLDLPKKLQLKNNNRDENRDMPSKNIYAVQSEPQPNPYVDDDFDNDVDMFGSGSVKETNVQLIKNSGPVASEIFAPTIKTGKTQNVEKREREHDDIEIPHMKKQKLDTKIDKELRTGDNSQKRDEVAINESENMNYDVIMSQVFASIDADIKSQKKTQCTKNKKNLTHMINDEVICVQKNLSSSEKDKCKDQKDSENVFSFLEKESEPAEAAKGNLIAGPETQDNIQKLLTPGMLRDLASANVEAEINDVEMQDTPMMDDDESDKSVVEETPQKNISLTNLKQKTEISAKNSTNDKPIESRKITDEKKTQDLGENDSQIIKSIINISDTLVNSNKTNVSVVERTVKHSMKLETPVTINKFVKQIQHKSTPVARKSLNFDESEIVVSEQTLCPTSTQDKPSQSITVCPTTQEREFLVKAFEQTPSPVKMPVKQRTPQIKEGKKFCVAGSCLSAVEITNLKKLCAANGWTFVDKYTKDLTHLVVGVDEENKSQRSVKFMCALAASKWIVSYSWVEQCLKAGIPVDEEPYEALDATGDPGPNLSRTSSQRLFEGFTFYCMPPFSILDVECLKYMVEAAGGVVVGSAREVRVAAGAAPRILIAEPQHTQEDKFIYLAMELSVVPVNFEWVLNCLGSYCLNSIHDLLLCPPTLLPPACSSWPPQLIAPDRDDD